MSKGIGIIFQNNLFYYFIIYSFLGWLMETILVSATNKKFINRGFLNGPFCPIYGIGMLSIILILSPYQNDPAFLFFGGLIIATTVEYITGFLLEKIFHTTWWDYSHKKYNLHGRISLDVSLSWGALSVIMVEYVQPFMASAVEKIPASFSQIFIPLCVVYFVWDTISTCIHIVQMDKPLNYLNSVKEEMRLRLEHSQIFISSEELRRHLHPKKPKELADLFKDRLEVIRQGINTSRKNALLNVQKELDELAQNYDDIYIKLNKAQQRLIKAFPSIHSTRAKKGKEEIKQFIEQMRKEFNKNK